MKKNVWIAICLLTACIAGGALQVQAKEKESAKPVLLERQVEKLSDIQKERITPQADALPIQAEDTIPPCAYGHENCDGNHTTYCDQGHENCDGNHTTYCGQGHANCDGNHTTYCGQGHANCNGNHHTNRQGHHSGHRGHHN